MEEAADREAPAVPPAVKKTWVTVIYKDQLVPQFFALEVAGATPLLWQFVGGFPAFTAGDAYTAGTGGTTMETVTSNPTNWSALCAESAPGKRCLEDAWPSVYIQDEELFFKDFQHHVFATYPNKAPRFQGKIYEVQLIFKGTCTALIWCAGCSHSGLGLAMWNMLSIHVLTEIV